MNPGLPIMDNFIDLCIMMLAGIAVSAFFDLFRAMRKAVKDNGGENPNAVVQLQDLLFAMSSFLFVLLLIYRINDGILRSYILIGLFLGMFLYAIILGRISGRLFYYVFYGMFAVLRYVFKMLKHIFGKPAAFLASRFRKLAEETAQAAKQKLEEQKLKETVAEEQL